MTREPFDKGFALRRESLWRAAMGHHALAANDRVRVDGRALDALAT